MIDFIKLYYSDKSRLETFVKNGDDFYELDMVLGYKSGEIKYPYRTNLKNLNITLSEESGAVRNSIHKLHNILEDLGDQNHNDFTYSNLSKTISYLSNKIIDSSTTKITQLEFGLNINLEVPAELIIRKNVLMHNLHGYNHNRKYYGKGELKQFDHHNYFIKIYDKAKQFELDENILRFEIKFIKAIEFQKLGIYILEDLRSKSNLTNLFIYLLRKFDELTIVDEIDFESILNLSDRHKLTNYINSNFWTVELEKKSRQTKSNHNKEFKRILVEYNLLNAKTHIKKLLIQKFIFLLNN